MASYDWATLPAKPLGAGGFMSTLLFAVAVILASLPVQASADTFTPPNGWIVVPAPDAERLSCANRSRAEWTVSIRDGSIAISERTARGDTLPPALAASRVSPRGALHVLPVEGGYLVGRDAGEFGGGLTWFSADGKDRMVLNEKPTAAIIPLGRDAALSFDGLNHLGLRVGSARWLSRENGVWAITRTAKLDGGPYAAVADERAAYVLGPGSLTLVSFDGAVKKIQDLPMLYLYPNSMALEPNGTLWVGARHFVLRLSPQGADRPFAVTWLVPIGCETVTKRDFDCVCGQ